MFCAIVTTIERCKTEGVVDVFQVVKALRVQKPGAVLTVVSSILQCTYTTHSGMYVHILCMTECFVALFSYRTSTRLCLKLSLCSWTLLILTLTFRMFSLF